jgi:hypothetical protein
MPGTYEPIATTTLGSATATISFTSIAQTYTDLVIVTNARGTASNHLYARWGNGSYDTGNNYSNTGLWARSTTDDYGSARNTSFGYARLSPYTYAVPSATSTFGTVVTHIQNYSNTTTFKTVLTRCSGIGASDYAGPEAAVILWRSTSAINQIQFSLPSGNFETGTTITLYGIKAA